MRSIRKEKDKKTMNKFAFLIIPVAGAVLLAGCSSDTGKKVMVESVADITGTGSTAGLDRYAGVIESSSDVKVEKDSNKTVSEVLVKVGDTVSKEQVLFRYDESQTKLNAEKARIELEQLKSSVESKRAEIATLEREIGSADADNRTSYTLQIQELKADITETEYNISSKEKELENLEKTLENLDVKSPSDGKIQSVNSAENADDKTFITIRQTGNFRIKGYVNETNRSSLHEGMEVVIRSRVDDVVQKGTIKTIDLKNPSSASTTEDSGFYMGGEGDDTSTSSKYPFYVELAQTEGFIIGQHVYIEPDYGQTEIVTDGLYLPGYYINDTESTPWVWAKSEGDRLEKRSLELGEYKEELDSYEIKNGLSTDDYIAPPDSELKAGMTCIKMNQVTGDEKDVYVPGMEGPVTDDMQMVEENVVQETLSDESSPVEKDIAPVMPAGVLNGQPDQGEQSTAEVNP